jgi:hypothetical protein
VGGMLSTRSTGRAHNYVGGLDWNYKFWENYYVKGEAFLSDTREVDDTTIFSDSRGFGSTGHDASFNGEQFGGSSGQISFQRNARSYSFSVQYVDRTPTFQAQDGFVPNNNLRTLSVNQNYSFYPAGPLVDQWFVALYTGLHYNSDGIRKEKWALPNLYVQLKGQTNISLTIFAVNDELYKGVQFDRINRTEISVNIRPASFLSFSFDGSFGRFIKRSDAPDMGRGHSIGLSAQIKPTSQLEIDLSYSRARLSSVATGELFYDGYIARTTGIYQFTKEMFLRAIGQYDQFSREINVYPLLSYKLGPYTIFYAGSTYTLSDFGEPYGIQKTAVQYFLKLQYLIRA